MQEEWLTLQRAEELYCIPVATWRRWLRERRVGHSRLGGRILVRRADIESWLSSNFRPANSAPSIGKKRATKRDGTTVDPSSVLAGLLSPASLRGNGA